MAMENQTRRLHDPERSSGERTLETELCLEHLDLIATDDDEVPTGEGMEVEDRIDSVLIPIPRMGHFGVWIMTIALAAISTPICYFIATSLDAEVRSGVNPWLIKCAVFTSWLLSVFGPVSLYYWVPIGWWSPDHWLQYTRSTGVLSFRGGYQEWDQKQIRFFLAINGYRARRKNRETQLQICVGDTRPFQRYVLLAMENGDPEKSYGKILRTFASATQVPAYIARITRDGVWEVVQEVDKPSDAPQSPDGLES